MYSERWIKVYRRFMLFGRLHEVMGGEFQCPSYRCNYNCSTCIGEIDDELMAQLPRVIEELKKREEKELERKREEKELEKKKKEVEEDG